MDVHKTIIWKGTIKLEFVKFSGNSLNCDAEFDGFVDYLVSRGVRTFVPLQPEILCVSPSERKNLRLKELMIRKANETLLSSMQNVQQPDQQNGDGSAVVNNLLKRLLPGFVSSRGGVGVATNLSSDTSKPTNGLSSDIGQLLKMYPNMIVNIPGIGKVDVNKVVSVHSCFHELFFMNYFIFWNE